MSSTTWPIGYASSGKRANGWRRGRVFLITGCPIGGAAEKVVKAIEDNGGWVVGF
ncbi:putative 2-hydroxyglutaryl-CoA dehydratase [Klebsiella michiganensis]|uniref:Putative 2-hydroxyglutaryl-CoA dehydratase n=1 Tax=Klebsiella michiganensis TaxID=1134687 RepID=A0A7H4N8I8_9ENTR|nr:putative 2-hydroxyglutaryl-CoA dehydratase [Klebsiella michiganensis]